MNENNFLPDKLKKLLSRGIPKKRIASLKPKKKTLSRKVKSRYLSFASSTGTNFRPVKEDKQRFTRSSQNFRPKSQSHIVKDFYLTTALKMARPSFSSNFKITKQKNLQTYEEQKLSKFGDKISEETQIFLKNLDLEQREFFNDKANGFTKIFEKFDSSFKEICKLSDQVKNYRYRLGHNLSVSLNKIFDVIKEIVNNVYKTIQYKEKMKNRSLEEYEKKFINFHNMYNLLKEEHNCVHQLVKVKDSEFKMLNSEFECLKSKNKYLNEVIRNSDIMNGAIEWEPNGELKKIKYFEKTHKERVKFYENAKAELKNERDRFSVWFDAYEKEESNKSKILGRMDDLLKAMLKSQKHDKMCQVNEAGLIWNPQDLVNPKVVDKVNVGASDIYLTNHFKSNTKFLQMSTSALGNDILTGEFNFKGRNPDVGLNKALQRIKELEKATYAEKIKNAKLKVNPKEKMIWRLPYVLKLFLANSFAKNKQVKVRPWIYLREDISGLFEYFCRNYGFLNGGNIGKPTSLEEMVCMYFLEVSPSNVYTLEIQDEEGGGAENDPVPDVRQMLYQGVAPVLPLRVCLQLPQTVPRVQEGEQHRCSRR